MYNSGRSGQSCLDQKNGDIAILLARRGKKIAGQYECPFPQTDYDEYVLTINNK